jgi:hypothetical protein
MFTKDEQQSILNAVETAIRQTLSKTFGRDIEVVIGDPRGKNADAILVVALAGPPISFDVQIKMSVTPATIAALGARTRPSPLMVFCPRLTPAVMDACRQLGIACADADGNLFLRSGSNAVDVQGLPPTVSRQLATGSNKAARLTSRSGLQILFVLLSEPALRNEPLRIVSGAARTSLGSVAAVFHEMERHGYMTTTSKGRTLRRTGELFDMWVDGYRLRLFERLRLGTFTTDVPEWWKASHEAIRAVDAQWGSETALWATGRNLRPARGVLYVDALPSSLIAELRLRRDARPDAPVEFRRRFWDVPTWHPQASVPSALIYADLLADGDPRLVEAASTLRKDNEDLRRLDAS